MLNSALIGDNTITFQVSGPVLLRWDLPAIQQPGSTIDGGGLLGQPPIVSLRPDPNLSTATNGFNLSAGASEVRHITVGGFAGTGIRFDGNDNRLIGCFIGVTEDGQTVRPNGTGVSITSGSNDSIGGTMVGEGNLISGNITIGLEVAGTSDHVIGNLIGTDIGGTLSLGNGTGILLDGGDANTIGGDTSADRNVISGNGAGTIGSGIQIVAGANQHILGNYIGTDVGGTMALANTGPGIEIDSLSSNDTIGGLSQTERNVISGNMTSGTLIAGSGHVIEGNYIGTDFQGMTAIPNNIGITLSSASNVLVGGTQTGASNLISGNLNTGLALSGSGNVVRGNLIGTDPTGMLSLGNQGNGVAITGGSNNTIGGTTPADRNIISGNRNPDPTGTVSGTGLLITGGASGNQVQGNYIGLTVDGRLDLGNDLSGIAITGGASFNTIGGTIPSARNVISGNRGPNNLGIGISILGPGTSSNLIAGNFIGTDTNGFGPIGTPNPFANGVGISITFGAQNNIVGDDTPRGAMNPHSRPNFIAGNIGAGIAIGDRFTSNNFVVRNYIGLVFDSMNVPHGLGNGEGVDIYDAATANRIGGLIPPDPSIGGTPTLADFYPNWIEANHREGVRIYDSNTSNNLVQNNFIGVYEDPVTHITTVFPNDIGVALAGFSSNNLIGGTVVVHPDPLTPVFLPAGNVISGNTHYGVAFYDRRTFGNVVQSNMIGPDRLGMSAVIDPNSGLLAQQVGVAFFGGAGDDPAHSGNTLGGTLGGTLAAYSRNIISGNRDDGVTFFGFDTAFNVVEGNFIGTDVTGNQLLMDAGGNHVISNGGNGIKFYWQAHDNTIGGTMPNTGNLISGNMLDGILVSLQSNHNKIYGNYIGVDDFFITGNGTTMCAPLDFRCDTPAFTNNMNGIHIQDPGSDQNAIGGIFVSDSTGNLTYTGAGNYIAFNQLDGILVETSIHNSILHNNIYQPLGATTLGIHLAAINAGQTVPGNANLPNPVVIDSLTYDPVMMTVTITGHGHLDPALFPPMSTYIVDFFANSSSQSNEGEIFLIDSVIVTTDANGDFVLDVMLPIPAYFQNPNALPATITTTFTDTFMDPVTMVLESGNTSQFSDPPTPFPPIGAPDPQGGIVLPPTPLAGLAWTENNPQLLPVSDLQILSNLAPTSFAPLAPPDFQPHTNPRDTALLAPDSADWTSLADRWIDLLGSW